MTQGLMTRGLIARGSGRGGTGFGLRGFSGAAPIIGRIRSEANANRGSVSRGFGHKEPGAATLSPALRTRSAPKHDERDLVEDLVTLLRREYRTNTN